MFVCKCSGVGSRNGYVSRDYKKFFHWLFHLLTVGIKNKRIIRKGKEGDRRINRIRFQCLVYSTPSLKALKSELTPET